MSMRQGSVLLSPPGALEYGQRSSNPYARPSSAQRARLPDFPPKKSDELNGYRPGSIAAYLNSPGGTSYTQYPHEYGRSPASSAAPAPSSYVSSIPSARSSSVPRPGSRTSAHPASTVTAAYTTGAAAYAAGAATYNAGAAAYTAGAPTYTTGAAGAASMAPSGTHLGGRSVLRAPGVLGAGSSILDSLRSPSVTTAGVVASLAQRTNSTSGLDYSSLGAGAGGSSFRLKREQSATSQQHSYTSLGAQQSDQLRAAYLSGPASASAAATYGSSSRIPSAAANAGAGASSVGVPRRGSLDRTAGAAVAARLGSFSGAGASAGAASAYGAGSGSGGIPSAPPLQAGSGSYAEGSYGSSSGSHRRAAELPGGAVYASQYAPGSSVSTVYIPVSSQQGAYGTGGGYGNSSGHGSGAAAGAILQDGRSGLGSREREREREREYAAQHTSQQYQHQHQHHGSPLTASGRGSSLGASTGTGRGLPPTAPVLHQLQMPSAAPSAPPLASPVAPSTAQAQGYTTTVYTSSTPVYISPSQPPSSAAGPGPAIHQAASRTLPTSTQDYVGGSRTAQRIGSSSARHAAGNGAAAVAAATAAATMSTAVGSSTAGGSRLRSVGTAAAARAPADSLDFDPLRPAVHATQGAGVGGAGYASGSTQRREQQVSDEQQDRPLGSGRAASGGPLPVTSPYPSMPPAGPFQAAGYAERSPRALRSMELPPPGTVAGGAGAGVDRGSGVDAGRSGERLAGASLGASARAEPRSSPIAGYAGGSSGSSSAAALDSGGSSYTSTASGGSSGSSNNSMDGAGSGIGSSNGGKGLERDPATVTAGRAHRSAAQPVTATPSISSTTTSQHQLHTLTQDAMPHTHGAASTPKSPASPRVALVGAKPSREAGQAAAAAAAPVASGPVAPGCACGPLPDLPVLSAPRDAGPGRGCVGLQNLGNTCFMNSILQSLNAVPELVTAFHKPADKAWSSKAVVAPAYSGLVRDMLAGSCPAVVNPNAFLRKVAKHDARWGDGRQQDSQEFLNSLLEVLQSECNRVVGKPQYRELPGKGPEDAQAAEAFAYARTWNDSPIDDIFGGLLQSTLTCRTCARTSHTFEPFLGLAVPIPSTSSTSVSVADCLRAFVEPEELAGEDSYKCESCKSCQPHTKRLQIYRPPRVLVLTLKRFTQRSCGSSGFGFGLGGFGRSRSMSKNNSPVQLGDASGGCGLDLVPYCNPLGLRELAVRGRPVTPAYQLVAVSHHSGSLEGGHYTAQARSCMDGQWYNFNDSHVRKEPSCPAGSSSSAYVLFYRMAHLQPSSL